MVITYLAVMNRLELRRQISLTKPNIKGSICAIFNTAFNTSKII